MNRWYGLLLISLVVMLLSSGIVVAQEDFTPQMISWSISPSEISKGECVTISWEVVSGLTDAFFYKEDKTSLLFSGKSGAEKYCPEDGDDKNGDRVLYVWGKSEDPQLWQGKTITLLPDSTPVSAPIVKNISGPLDARPGEMISFSADIEGAYTRYTFKTPQELKSGDNLGSPWRLVVHAPDAPGTYSYVIQVFNGDLASNTMSASVFVIQPKVVSFEVDIPYPVPDQSVTFLWSTEGRYSTWAIRKGSAQGESIAVGDKSITSFSLTPSRGETTYFMVLFDELGNELAYSDPLVVSVWEPTPTPTVTPDANCEALNITGFYLDQTVILNKNTFVTFSWENTGCYDEWYLYVKYGASTQSVANGTASDPKSVALTPPYTGWYWVELYNRKTGEYSISEKLLISIISPDEKIGNGTSVDVGVVDDPQSSLCKSVSLPGMTTDSSTVNASAHYQAHGGQSTAYSMCLSRTLRICPGGWRDVTAVRPGQEPYETARELVCPSAIYTATAPVLLATSDSTIVDNPIGLIIAYAASVSMLPQAKEYVWTPLAQGIVDGTSLVVENAFLAKQWVSSWLYNPVSLSNRSAIRIIQGEDMLGQHWAVKIFAEQSGDVWVIPASSSDESDEKVFALAQVAVMTGNPNAWSTQIQSYHLSSVYMPSAVYTATISLSQPGALQTAIAWIIDQGNDRIDALRDAFVQGAISIDAPGHELVLDQKSRDGNMIWTYLLRENYGQYIRQKGDGNSNGSVRIRCSMPDSTTAVTCAIKVVIGAHVAIALLDIAKTYPAQGKTLKYLYEADGIKYYFDAATIVAKDAWFFGKGPGDNIYAEGALLDRVNGEQRWLQWIADYKLIMEVFNITLK